jgi:hypothetical protein
VQQQQSCYVKADYNAAGSVAESSCILVSHVSLRSQRRVWPAWRLPTNCYSGSPGKPQRSWCLATCHQNDADSVCMLTQSSGSDESNAAEKNAFAVFQSASPAGNNGAAEKPIWCAAHP